MQAGDAPTVEKLLRTTSKDALAGDEGSRLLRAAAIVGDADVVSDLLDAGVDPARPWEDGVDPVSWAADFGAYEVLCELLYSGSSWRKQVPQHGKLAALEIARAWLSLDPEVELRRRLGAHQDEPAVVERVQVPIRDQGRRQATRIRLTLADGRQAETQIAHRAIVTDLEEQLGMSVSPDELLARALFHADPESSDWGQSQVALWSRGDAEEVFRWAASLVAHPSVDTRRFATELLHLLGCQEQPSKAQALDVLRPRLRAEDDVVALNSVIGAFAEYTDRGDLTDILHLAAHPTPGIRARVAGELVNAIGEPPQAGHRPDLTFIPFDTPPEVLATLIHLASDVDADVRANALLTVAESGIDTPTVREVLTAHLTDDHRSARLNAAAGLALREDQRGLDVLRQVGSELTPTDVRRWRVYGVEKVLEYRASGEEVLE